MASFPARLHVLLARDSSRAVVIRRGPSQSVCTVLWDRKTDEFTLGQWMRGRIYERRCDLSPNGQHLIYFAMNAKWSSETRGSWTAVSRAPYLKAVTLLPKGDCWNGGGLFIDNRRYWLNDPYGAHEVLHDAGVVRRDQTPGVYHEYRGECTGIYYQRLERDGWVSKGNVQRPPWSDVQKFEKTHKGGWSLVKYAHADIGHPPGKGCYWDGHELVHAESGASIDGKNWEWAEIDAGRLLWAKEGKISAAYLRRGELHDEKVLHDFNSMKFEALPDPY